MGFGAADVLGARRAVDAVTGAVEADPDGADGIVGAGLEREFAVELLGFLGLGENFRIEKVGGIGCGAGDVEFADGPFLDLLGDAARELREEVGARVVHLELALGEQDADVGGLLSRGGRDDVGDFQFGVGGHVAPVDRGVQLADVARVRVEFFGDEFKGVFIIEPALLRFGQPRRAQRLEAGEVLGLEDVGGHQRAVEGEARLGGLVEDAGGRQVFLTLKTQQGGAGLRAGLAIDGARGDAAPREGDLGFEQGLGGMKEVGRRDGRDGYAGHAGIGGSRRDDEAETRLRHRIGARDERVEIRRNRDAGRGFAAVRRRRAVGGHGRQRRGRRQVLLGEGDEGGGATGGRRFALGGFSGFRIGAVAGDFARVVPDDPAQHAEHDEHEQPMEPAAGIAAGAGKGILGRS